MSGHSKWANIRVRKGAQDAKRNKVYTKHARLIEIAARSGGPDPKTNAALRSAIESAKEDSVPNDNIERAVKKGTGALKGEAMQEVLYAAYLPLRSSEGAEGGAGGVACLIECLTDNRNRTIANVKGAISKGGGNFAETGSVLWMFDRKGVVAAAASEQWEENSEQWNELQLELIDIGAEDVSANDGIITVISLAMEWPQIRDHLKKEGMNILSAGLSYVAKQKTAVDAAMAEKVAAFVETLEEDDDVSEVHTNAEV